MTKDIQDQKPDRRIIGITLTREDFATLVTGKVVTKDWDYGKETIELLLEAMDFKVMDDLLNRARVQAGTGEVVGPPLPVTPDRL